MYRPLVADLIRSLEGTGVSQGDIDALNAAFRRYRLSAGGDSDEAASEFMRTLQELSEQHACLVSRCADLQSRIDEHLRKVRKD